MYKVTFVMDGFDWSQRGEAERRMQILLDALTKMHIDYLRTHPRTPLLYQSGVRYEREPPGREDWQDVPTTLKRRTGDCEDLATWRAAEGIVRGIPLRAFGRPRPMVVQTEDGPRIGTLWHILVRWPNGAIEDPSLKLGMKPASPEFATQVTRRVAPVRRASPWQAPASES